MENIQIKFTQEEIKLLIEIINNVNFNGQAIEKIYPLKIKIKLALDNISNKDISDVDKK